MISWSELNICNYLYGIIFDSEILFPSFLLIEIKVTPNRNKPILSRNGRNRPYLGRAKSQHTILSRNGRNIPNLSRNGRKIHIMSCNDREISPRPRPMSQPKNKLILCFNKRTI